MQVNNIPFTDLFDIYKETDNYNNPNLKEENIYKYSEWFSKGDIKRVPVFSGATLNEGIVGFIPDFTDDTFKNSEQTKKVFKNITYYKNDKDYLTIVADGKAGFLFYRDSRKYPLFAMNISCMALFKKEDAIIKKSYPNYNGLSLKWFYMKFFDYFSNLVNKEGVAHFTQEIYNTLFFDIPQINEQKKELALFEILFNKRSKLSQLVKKLNRLNKITPISKGSTNIDSFSNIFDIRKGTHGFTELAIYHNLPELKEKKVPFWGGDITHITPKRFVSQHAKNIKGENVTYFNEKECIILTVDGASAGSMTYKKELKFTLNHHAGVLTLKDKYKGKINLEWFSYRYQSILKSITVSTGSKTLSEKMLKCFQVEFYDNPKMQKNECELYRDVRTIRNNVYSIIRKISNLACKNIV